MPSEHAFSIERIVSAGTLTDRVFQALMQLIDTHDLEPGAKLPSEMAMAKRFGVSRTVIREAISRLKSEGKVESRQGSGVFVRELSPDSPFRIHPGGLDSTQSTLQVIELRQTLEGEIAALAAQRRSKKQLVAIRQAMEKIESDVRAGGDGVDADIEFHHRIAEATGNPHFVALIEFLTKLLRAVTRTLRIFEATQPVLTQQVIDEHQGIVDAIAAQDCTAAREAARRHMEGAAKRLSSAEKHQA